MAFAPAEGSLAILFQRACGNLQKLQSYLTKDQSLVAEFQRCSDDLGRLHTWDIDIRATDGNLDYGLRNSSSIRESVRDLLRELTDLNTEGDYCLNSQIGTAEMDAKPPLQTLNYLSEQDSVTELSETGSTASSDPWSQLSSSTTTLCSPLELVLREINDIVSCLLQQVPSLQDPEPHDIKNYDQHEGADFADQSHVKTKFPRADEQLIKRLGSTNWKRRQQLMRLMSKPGSDGSAKDECLSNNPSPHDQDFLTVDAVTDTKSDFLTTYSVSTRPHIFSGPNSTIGTAITSVGDESSTPALQARKLFEDMPRNQALRTSPRAIEINAPPVDINRLGIPRPPELGASYSGHQFKCPYCLYDLVEVLSTLDWKTHLMRDLEPYMCTFRECHQPRRTYGTREAWIQHEMDCHQNHLVWFCRPCKTQFSTRDSFDNHMRTSHPDIATQYQMNLFADICQQSSTEIQCRTLCPLCLESPRKAKKFYNHLADHLEQLALFAALPLRSEAESEDEFDLMDDSSSEGDNRPDSVFPELVESSTAEAEDRQRDLDQYLGDQADAIVTKCNNSQAVVSGEAQKNLDWRPKVHFPILTISHPENDFFYGRDVDIDHIHQKLSDAGEIVIVHGVGGVGKTVTSVEYAYRYKEAYDCIFYLLADTAPGLAESYGEIARSLGLVKGNEEQNIVLELGRNWLQTTDRKWLLIYDNVEDFELVLNYLPRDFSNSRGAVLVTTQDPDLAPKVKHRISLGTFGEDEGSDMLVQYLNRASREASHDKKTARTISGLVGGLPVAISHVAGYVAYSRCSLEELLEIFKQRRRHIGVATTEDDDLPAAFRQSSFSYDETMSVVWNVTLRELPNDSQNLCQILAYLNSEAVPESILCDLHTESFLEFLDIRENIRYERMKENLIARRLVQAKEIDGEPCLSLHRSLQRSIRETAAKNIFKQEEVFSQALTLVRKAFPFSSPIQVPEPSKWKAHQHLLPHVLSLRRAFVESKQAIRGSHDLVSLLSDAGINQYEQGFTKDGLILLKTAEQILETITFEDSDSIKTNINYLIALMHDNSGISVRAESLRRREAVVDARKKRVASLSSVSRNEEILLHNAWLDLTLSYLQFHRWQEAEPILLMCLEKYSEWGSPTEIPFEYGKCYHKIMFIRMYQGDTTAALDMGQKGVFYMAQAGNEMLMLRFKFDLACLHLQLQDLDKSLTIHQEVLDRRLIICGRTNEHTLQSYYSIGVIHEMQGNFSEAERLYRLALDNRRAAAWTRESIARTQFHFSRVLRAQDKDPDRANKNNLEAKAVLERLLPLDLPDQLKEVEDEEVLFDHMQTFYGARFTSSKLLPYFQEN